MTRPASCVIRFWCDRPVMTSDPAVCSKELSAGTFNYRGDWFWPQSPPRLVFIFKLQTDCKTTLPALSSRTKRCSCTKAAGALIIILWATVTLFLLTAPSAPRLPHPHLSLLHLLFSLSFKYLSAHIKTDVKCTRYMLYLRQIRASCVRAGEFILERYCKHLHVLRVLII